MSLFFVFHFSRIKKSRDDYIKRLNGIYETNLEKVSLLCELDDVQQDQVFKCTWNACTHKLIYSPVMRLSHSTYIHAPAC